MFSPCGNIICLGDAISLPRFIAAALRSRLCVTSGTILVTSPHPPLLFCAPMYEGEFVVRCVIYGTLSLQQRWGGVACIATRCGLEGPEIESR